MKHIVEKIVDDVDGTILSEYETVTFAVDGTTYEFDTSLEHAAEFRDSLRLYIEKSRQIVNGNVVTRKRVAAVGQDRPSAEQLRAIRDWARKNGHEVSNRGRVPAEIVEAFEAAHPIR